MFRRDVPVFVLWLPSWESFWIVYGSPARVEGFNEAWQALEDIGAPRTALPRM